jgi:anthranilate synthase component 2
LKILLLDNYDSFTYNLLHYLESFDVEVTVALNDQIKVSEVSNFDKIVLSPGPGLPNNAGIMNVIIETYGRTKPILGVCLGFQALVEYFGGELYNQSTVKHGRAEEGFFDLQSRLFKETSPKFNIGLYHSWAAKNESFPRELKITGRSKADVIMAFEHESLPVAGVQFHPESILTEHGMKIVENFIFNFK